MATILHELKDCIVTDAGEVIVNYRHFVIGRLLSMKSVEGLRIERQSFAERTVRDLFASLSDQPDCDVEYHNAHCSPGRVIAIGEIDGIPERPPSRSFEFNIPDEYQSFDLLEYLAEKLAARFPDQIPQKYVERLSTEWAMFTERNMENFVRSLIFMVETWDGHNVVHGVGRGSACASLILYLVGVHMVDPVEFEIPIHEFLR